MNIRNSDLDLRVRWGKKEIKQYAFSFISLFFLLILIYANSFDCSWHFDDYANIVENSNVQIKTFSWQSVQKGLYGIGGVDRWQRPLSYFSFAVNYYFGGLNVFGYHLVNFIIHYIASIFLFLFIYNTLRLPVLEGRYERNAYSIALLSAVFWAIHPIQATAVTYIVQRMASMAAMFYMMAMYFYLKGRTGDKTWKRVTFFVLAVFSAVLSVGSKENAAMLPVSLFLFELFLIQGITIENIRKNWKLCLLSLLLVPAIGLVYYDFSSISGEYEHRPFSMMGRVLTQPRVILFYISLLLYPVTSRLMLIHDMEISTSLFAPWTTLAAMVVILLILVSAVSISRRRPLVSYCIIFFFLNHLIEGSVFSLGLVYEHRNYLPSMLFFVPLSMLIINGLHYFVTRRRMFVILSSAVTAIIIILGVTVSIQNNILKNEISLWSDNAGKTPRLDIVHNNLGAALLRIGRLPEAFAELTKALESSPLGDINAKFKTYQLLGDYYLVMGDNDKALVFIDKALDVLSSKAGLYNNKAAILIAKKMPEEAETMMQRAISSEQGKAIFHVNLGKIFLYRGYPDKAIKEAQKAILMDGDYLESYLLLSGAFKAKKDYRTAGHFGRLASASKMTKRQCP
ncbi:MAG: hypothetical protein NTZ24_14670 [Deltaproteobacteria bacterium]|nr:hypothetical protein [Deltaproteobacteria bacterium]